MAIAGTDLPKTRHDPGEANMSQQLSPIKLHKFHGGIHPAQQKHLSNGKASEIAGMPDRLLLPLKPQIGNPAKPLVAIGDKVIGGQVIAEASGPISLPVIAPTSGQIQAIEDHPMPTPAGIRGKCFVLIPDGSDQQLALQPIDDYANQDRNVLLDRIRQSGIAGMGGAGFPTSVKLKGLPQHPISTLIINGAECEPYITSDDLLMRERTLDMLRGIEIMQHLSGAETVLLAVEDNKPLAITAIQTALAQLNNSAFAQVTIPTLYPSGGEKQLIKILTGKEVPSGKLPAELGVVVQNVATAAAVYDAIVIGKPLTRRYITVTGEAIKSPGNYITLLGTPTDWLLTRAKADYQKVSRLVMGGPMMGFAVKDTDTPLTQTSNCIIAATEQEMPSQESAMPCIRCGQCAEVCPANLLPQQLFWFAQSKSFEKSQAHNLFDCIECGACAWVCPSNIPLVQYYRYSKNEIRVLQVEKDKAEHAKMRHDQREARIELEKQQKAEKHRLMAEKRKAQLAAKTAAEEAAASGDTSSIESAPLDSASLDPVAAALARTKAKKAAAANAGVSPGKLKTELAIARTKLKKVQRELDKAKDAGQALTDAEAAVATAQSAVAAKEQQLASAIQQTEKDNAPDLKALKTAASIARTKAKKAVKAAEEAESEARDDAQQLGRFALDAQQKADKAIKEYEAAEKLQPQDSPEVDLKLLKSAAAIARTKAKKAAKMADDAQATNAGNAPALKKAADLMQNKADVATKAFEDAEKSQLQLQPKSPAAPVAAGADLKQLKIAAAIARTKAKKATKLADEAEAENADNASELRKLAIDAQQKSDQSDKALNAAQAVPAATDKAAVDLKPLKIAAAIARTKAKKTTKLADEAEAENADNAAELRKLAIDAQQKSDQADQALNAAQPSPVVADKPAVDIKAFKVAAAIARTKAKKAAKLADEAEAENADNAAELRKLAIEAENKALAANKKLEAETTAMES